jgi:hypothetical protein
VTARERKDLKKAARKRHRRNEPQTLYPNKGWRVNKRKSGRGGGFNIAPLDIPLLLRRKGL